MAMNLATEDVLPAGEPATPGLPAGKTRGMFVRGLEVFLENRLAIAGVVMLALIFGFCFLGPFLYHTDQIHVNLANENLSPGPAARSAPTSTATTSSAG